MAGLLSLPRQATVTSIGESVVERYGINDFETLIKDYPEVALQIMKSLVTRLLELTRKCTETSDDDHGTTAPHRVKMGFPAAMTILLVVHDDPWSFLLISKKPIGNAFLKTNSHRASCM